MHILLLALLSSAAQAQEPCRQPEWVLNEVNDSVSNFAAADALDALAGLTKSYACSDVADKNTLADLWLGEGMAHVYSGDLDSAKLAFAAAARTVPGRWTDAYGDRSLYDEAASSEAPEGSLRIVPVPEGMWVAVDGDTREAVKNLPSGKHLLQLGYPGEPASFALFVTVPAGGEQLAKHNLQPPAPAVVEAPPVVEAPDVVEAPPVVEAVPAVAAGPAPAAEIVQFPRNVIPIPGTREGIEKKFVTKKMTSKRGKRLTAAVTKGVIGVIAFGTAAGLRLSYDSHVDAGDWAGNDSVRLNNAYVINGFHVGSGVLALSSVISLSKGLSTPTDEDFVKQATEAGGSWPPPQ